MYVEKWVNRSLYENDAENVAFWDFRTSITFSVSFIRLLRKLLKSRTLSYLPTCLFACLLTHLFTYTDDGVMLSGSVTGPITTSNKNKKSNDFHPKINQLTSLIFPIKMYFFSVVFFFYRRGCLDAWALVQEEGGWKVNSSAKCVTIKSPEKSERTDRSQ